MWTPAYANQGIQYITKLVTPEEARKILEMNVKNRPIREDKVDMYARDIKNGKWVLNAETIKISDDNVLLDGQHRLLAIIKADTEVMITIAMGISDTRAFSTIDIGSKRTVSDTLKLSGVAHSNNIPAIAKRLLHWEKFKDKSKFSFSSEGFKSISNNEILEYIDNNSEEILNIQSSFSHTLPYRKCRSGTALVVSLIICKRFNEEEAIKFIDGIRTGSNLPENSPIGVLRNRLLDPPVRLGMTWEIELMAITIKAFNKFLKCEKSKQINWNRDGKNAEKFPSPGAK